MPKLQEHKNRFFITIPKELIQLKKWKKGTILAVGFNERENIEIKEVK